jgi:hypothetical protein
MTEEDHTPRPAVESIACSSNNGDYSGAYIPFLERHD